MPHCRHLNLDFTRFRKSFAKEPGSAFGDPAPKIQAQTDIARDLNTAPVRPASVGQFASLQMREKMLLAQASGRTRDAFARDAGPVFLQTW